MNGTLIARTAPRDSNTNIDAQFYFEYRLLYVTDIETIRAQYGDGAVRILLAGEEPTVLERRRVDTHNGIISPREWDVLNFGGSPRKAIEVADTAFLQAESLDPLHAEWVWHVAEVGLLNKELRELQDYTTPHKFARQSQLEVKWEDKFTAALKQARLYTAIQKGTAPRAKVDAIRMPLWAQAMAEKAEVKARSAELEVQIAKLEGERT